MTLEQELKTTGHLRLLCIWNIIRGRGVIFGMRFANGITIHRRDSTEAIITCNRFDGLISEEELGDEWYQPLGY